MEDEYLEEGEIYKKVFKENTEKKQDNTIKIANRGVEIYNQTILNKFQKFDQIEICVQDNYLERALYIIKQWEALGVGPLPEFKSKSGNIRFQKKEEDIVTRDGKSITRPVNRITLTKHPDIFRFTKK